MFKRTMVRLPEKEQEKLKKIVEVLGVSQTRAICLALRAYHLPKNQ